MTLPLIALLPLIGAILPPLFIKIGRNACALATASVTLVSLVLLLAQAPAVVAGEPVRFALPWIPQIGLAFSFFVDGLGLFFAALILIIGLLIITYARFYLSARDPMGKFFAYLLLFQGAMVGITISDNILLLIVFWELTSISSFLLIGYWGHLPEGRQGARMALAVTGAGGLALMAGMLILGQIAGSYELSTILANADTVQDAPMFVPALVLVLLGAFTKSAQFPFHFWLPHAMAAPTPVSAYLHSATMVKAGVFLLARVWPVFSGSEVWFWVVVPVGLLTMAIAAWIAIFKDDLKALLAYSTVSHLGLMTMLLGMGSPMAAVAAVFHILNHATFKCALFMTAGIVDHEAHTRDIKRLGGLLWAMPITATIATLAGLSMAGIPPFNGFISKEMMLEETLHTSFLGSQWLLPLGAGLAALFSVAYSLRYVFSTFFGKERYDYPHHPHDPPVGMWLPPAILTVLVVLIGLLPGLAEPLVRLTSGAVVGGALPEFHLYLWHGVNTALMISVSAILGGALLLLLFRPANALRLSVPRPEAKAIFEGIVESLTLLSRRAIAGTHTGSLQRYMAVIVGAVVVMGMAVLVPELDGWSMPPMTPIDLPSVFVWLVLIASCVLLLRGHQDRLFALIVTSVVGLIVSLAFLYFSAPDLALTQISVEVVTTILLLLALNLLPKRSPYESSRSRRIGDLVVASICGLAVTGLAYAVMTSGFSSISDYYLENAKSGGGGTNVVNVILVDFRGFDTFGEIIVLGIAALAIYALLESTSSGAAAARLKEMRRGVEAGDAHPLILVVVTRILLPLALMVGVFLFLRGHNMPGGGFIAGLVVGIALIMQYIASGYGWAAPRLRLTDSNLIGGGVLVAGMTGLVAEFLGYPFLTSTFTYLHIPVIGEVEVASAMAFDLGVFLTVVGVVMLVLANLARVERQATDEYIPEGPMDIKLSPSDSPSGVERPLAEQEA